VHPISSINMALIRSASQIAQQAGLLPCLARSLQRAYASASDEKFTVEVCRLGWLIIVWPPFLGEDLDSYLGTRSLYCRCYPSRHTK
jgi:hypothetical protein